MSTIFNDLRRLEAKRVSGALSQAEFAKQKSAILDSVPDALETDFTVVERSAPRSNTLWDTLLLWLVAAVLCATATWAITGNIAIASTLGITVLAAFTIKLFTALD